LIDLAARNSLLMSWTLPFLFACAVLPITVLTASAPSVLRTHLGPDGAELLETPARPAHGEALKAKMSLAILLEQQGKTEEAHQVYQTVMEGLTQKLAAAEQSATASPSSGALHHVARSAVQDALKQRAPKPHAVHAADTVLLAVNGRGKFIKQAAADGDLADPVVPTVTAAPDGKADGTPSKEVTVAMKEVPAPQDASKSGDGDMTKDKPSFLNDVSVVQLIPVYCGIVPVIAIVVVIFELVHRKWAGVDLTSSIDGFEARTEASEGMPVSHWLRGFWPLAKKFFWEGDLWILANALLMVLLFLSFWALFMDWTRNIWQKEFWDAIQQKHKDRFWEAMLLFALMAVVSVLTGTYQSYVQNILTIRWRAKLTKDLQERWLVGRAFCVQHFPVIEGGVKPLDNPDQRLQEDVEGFINGVLGVFFGFVMVVGRLCLFIPILIMLSPDYAFGIWYCPGWLLWVSLVYSGAGSTVTHAAGRWLIPLNFIKQQVEADYRHTAVQVRDNTESIALYGSEATENNRLSGRFDRIQRVVWEQMKYSKQLGFFTNFYFLANDIVPFCILAGNYFRGQITLGQMMQILGALGHVSDSLNSFVGAYTELANLRATTDRLHGFMEAVEKGIKYVEETTISKEVSPPGDNAALYAQEVCVSMPTEEGTKRILWDKAGLVVQPGERVLLLGPDGSGKSVFLRALAGSFPATGSCRIGRGDALFIPQRPFVPAGELREAVSYPEDVKAYTDEEITAAIQAVKLTALYEVPLSEVAEWQRRLSGGELQRLALAHALLRKPGLLVLDETTAAIGEEGTRELYGLLAKDLPHSTAVISVDHDAIREVGSWHNVHYTLDESTRKWVQISLPSIQD